jgi:hypothetical protein
VAHEIEVEIRPDGSIAFGVKGVPGRKCRDISKFLDELGLVVASDNTSEYFQEEVHDSAPDHAHVRIGKK